MIDNRLKKCCEDCEHINLKCGTEEMALRNVLNEITHEIYSFIACKHEQVCKKYIEEQIPINGMFVFKDANGKTIGTGEDLMRSAPERLDIPPCGFTRCRFYSNGNCGEENMYKNCEHKKLKQKEIEDGKSSIKINATP